MSQVTLEASRVLVITAVAGSGKTARIVDKLTRILVHGGVATVAVLVNSVRNEITQRVMEWARLKGYRVDHDGVVMQWDAIEKAWLQVGTTLSKGSSGSHDYLRIIGLPGVVHVASLDGLVHLALCKIGEVSNDGEIVFEERVAKDGTTCARRVVDGSDFTDKKRALRELLRDAINLEAAVDAIFPRVEGPDNQVGLFLDEFQDVEDDMVEVAAMISVEVARRGSGNLTMVVGDPRQNVFGHTEHSILDFTEMVTAMLTEHGEDPTWLEEQEMSVCHRCPQGHLDLVNHLYPPPHQAMIHPQERSQTQEERRVSSEKSRPIIVGIDTRDPRRAARAMAAEIEDQFRAMRDSDIQRGVHHGEQMQLHDVAVLSPKINDNPILSCLEDELNRRLACFAPPGESATKVFRTRDSQASIKWDDAKGRIAMLSIHADKGMTHRLHMMCDVTEGTLPHLGGGSEGQFESQLYVGLTRSRETLLVSLGVGNTEMACSTLFPNSTVNDRVISRYIRRHFDRPKDISSLCDWSQHSVCPLGAIVWFPNERYATIRDNTIKNNNTNEAQITTVHTWANKVKVEELIDSHPRTPLRFAENLTHHPGMLSARRATFELALRNIGRQRFQSAFRSRVGGEISISGSKRDGWFRATSAWRDRGEIAVAGAIDWACDFCGESVKPLSADLGIRARQLWCLALVDLADIHNDPFSYERPYALSAAAVIWVGGDHTGIDEAALQLAVKIDVNAMHAVEWLIGHLGTDAMSRALFDRDCCIVHPQRVWGRVSVCFPLAKAVVDIKITTVETGATESPDPGDLPLLPTLAQARRSLADGDIGLLERAQHFAAGIPTKRRRKEARQYLEIPEEQPSKGAMSHGVLYAAMSQDCSATRSIIVDISRGAQWECCFTPQERGKILERAMIK